MISRSVDLLRDMLRQTLTSWSRHESGILILLAGLIGVACGVLAVVFDWMISYANLFFLEGAKQTYGADNYSYRYLILPLTPAVGGLLIGLLSWLFKQKSDESASAAEVMKWTAVDGGRVSGRVIWFQALTNAIFLGSGGAGGREGPITQICGATGSIVGQFFKMSTGRLRLLVGCGAGAGIAAAFNAPIAGVIFAVELILADFNVISFLPIVISSVMATTTKRLIMGDIPAFSAPPYTVVSNIEIFLYFILGILCGIVAWLFFKAYFYAHDLFEHKLKISPVVAPAVGGLAVGIIGIFLPGVFASGYGTMNLMLNGDMLWTTAALLLVFKIIATSLSLGSGGAGGIFAPSLFIGCMAGGLFGYFVGFLFPDQVASPGAYAMVGVGAVMAAVAHAPLTNILMAYELTGNYQIILPIMTAAMMSTYVMTRLEKESLYTEKLRRRGIRLFAGRDLSVMDRISVGDVMSEDMTVIHKNSPFRQIMELIATSRDSYFPVVDENERLAGIISMQNIREIVLESAELADLVVADEISTKDVVTVMAKSNLNEAMEQFALIDIEQLPVVDEHDNKKIVGMLSRMDVMAAYNKEVLKKSDVD